MTDLLRVLQADDVAAFKPRGVSAQILCTVAEVIDQVRDRGEDAVRTYAEQWDGLPQGAPIFFDKSVLKKAFGSLPEPQRKVLVRTARRIEKFAKAQKRSLREMSVKIPGGRATQEISAVHTAGCYAPGGNYPLPSSVLMTALTARVAGVHRVFVASPKPLPVTLAAAHLARADGLLAVGGAQAIAALAFGVGGVDRCDMIVGPGNDYVTAAKKILFGDIQIDMLAGPTELVVVADGTAHAQWVAADLLAQAEHDVAALPVLIALDAKILADVQLALRQQLAQLSTRGIAAAALANGFAVLASSLRQAAEVTNRLAPEHLSLAIAKARLHRHLFKHYGAVFLGEGAAEVLGDYGVGPNHVLPTGQGARFTGGLSVLNFLRVRTAIEVRVAKEARHLYSDAAALADLEGLAGHAAAARVRMVQKGKSSF